MTWTDRLNELRRLKRNYLLFICLCDMKDVPEPLAAEISTISVEIDKIESMPISKSNQKIKFKTIEIDSKL